MRIKRLTIEGFRNLDSVSLKLSKLNVLIALNNYGKSNVIKAINFGLHFIKALPSEKVRMMGLEDVLPINKKNANKNYLFELTFESMFDEQAYVIQYSFSFEWIKEHNKGRKVLFESLKVKKSDKKQQFKTFIKRALNQASYLSSETGRPNSKLPIEEDELVLNKLEAIGTLFYQKILKEILNISLQINTSLNVDGIFNTIHLNSPKFDKLELNEHADIGEFIYALKKLHPDKFELLLDAILSLLPGLESLEPIEIDFREKSSLESHEDIPFIIPEKLYKVRIKEKANNQSTSIGSLSSGSQRIIQILCLAFSAQMNNVPLLVFEELENSIHPSLLQRLLMILNDLTGEAKMLLTSHSPYLLRYLEINNIYFGIPNKYKLADFRKIEGKAKQKKLMKEVLEYETSLGEYIFDLLIESANEPNELTEYIFS